MTKTTSRTLAAALAAASLVAAGCGGSDSEGSGGSATTASDDDRQLAFARCMREEGIEVDMPTSGGDGPRRTRIRVAPGAQPRKAQEAMEKCRKQTGGGPPELSDEQRTELRDQALRFAQCMRRNGVDMPDPGPDGGILRRRGDGGPNPESPAFRRAEQACRDLMPRMRGGGATEESAP